MWNLVRKRGGGLQSRGSSVGTRSALTNNVVVTYPTDSASGDLVIIAALTYRNSTTAYTITTPSGWTLLKDVNAIAAGGTRIALFSRVRGAETSVTISASATLFWVASAYAFRNFYAADPIEAVGNLQFVVGESQYFATNATMINAPSGILHLGGGALNATSATTETWGRGEKLGDYSVNPSSPAIRLTSSGAFENAMTPGPVSANVIRHNNRRVNQWAATIAIRPDWYVEPAPRILSLGTTAGPTAGGNLMYVEGLGFKGTGNTSETTVKVDGVSVPTANVSVLSSTLLTLTVPSGTAGTKNVTVHTNRGASNPLPYRYFAGDLKPLGMSYTGNWNPTNNATTKAFDMVPDAGTPAESVVNDALVIGGAGNVTVTASGAGTSTSSCTLRIFKNEVQVASGTATSATWTGDVVAGDTLDVRINKATTFTRSYTSVALRFTVNSVTDSNPPAPALHYSADFAGDGPLDSNEWFTTGGGVLDRVGGELNGDNTPSIPISFAWRRQPVPSRDVILRARLRWNGRNPEHSAVGLALRAQPTNDYGNPGTQNGVMFAVTAGIISLYYEDYDQTNGFVSITGTQYVTTSKFPENALLELKVIGNTYTASVDGVVKLTGTVSNGAISDVNRIVGLTIQNDELESGGGEKPARLDDFEIYTL